MVHCIEQRDTIAALATGKGNSALAIIRISGKNSFKLVSQCLLQEQRFLQADPRRIHLYRFYDKELKKSIDEITAIKYASPQSYTGEDIVEIMCHGGEVVIDEILSLLIKNGVRFAMRGEFTRRAYLNGKMDLLKAESIRQIIESTSKKQIATALEMYAGNTQKKLVAWKQAIKKILAEIEAGIDFPDEDDIKEKKTEHEKNIIHLYAAIEKEIKKRNTIKTAETGYKIPIIGIANAGKSSLFNMIIGYDRAIVHHQEGTTRDAVSEEVLMNGEKVKLIDTAGLNETENAIERMGIKKAWDIIKHGETLIWVTPANKKITKNEIKIVKESAKKKIIACISKMDLSEGKKKKRLLEKQEIPFIETCLVDENQREKIIAFIAQHIGNAIKNSDVEPGIICTKRHEEIVLRIAKKLAALSGNNITLGEDILAQGLRGILKDLEEFVGETSNEEILDMIFSDFCIGK